MSCGSAQEKNSATTAYGRPPPSLRDALPRVPVFIGRMPMSVEIT